MGATLPQIVLPENPSAPTVLCHNEPKQWVAATTCSTLRLRPELGPVNTTECV